MRQDLIAVAVVLRLELDISAGGQRRHLPIGEGDIAGPQPHVARAGLGHGLDGIDHEVLNDLTELFPIGQDVAGSRRHRNQHLGG